MSYGVRKFNWLDVTSYLTGNVFPAHEVFGKYCEMEHDVPLAFHNLHEILEARDWIADNIVEKHVKFGIFWHEHRESRSKIILPTCRCIGVRFVFNNDDDATFFRLSCHTGEKLEI